MDQKAIEGDGYDQGMKEGKEKINIAKKLLKQKIDINIIIEAAGLTKEEIERLK